MAKGAKTVKPKSSGGKAAGSIFDKINTMLFGKSNAAARRAGSKAGRNLLDMHKKK